MDSSLKYSELLECSESNSIENLLNKPSKKPRMVFKKSKVLARVMELIPRLQEQSIPESGDLNIENCPADKPYIELSAIGFTKEPENEFDPKMMILPECEESSDEDDDEEPTENESGEKRSLIEDISNQTLTLSKEIEKDLPSNEMESTSNRTENVEEDAQMEEGNSCEGIVH